MSDPTSATTAADPTQDVYTGVPAAEVEALRARLIDDEGAIRVDIHTDGQGTYTVTATFPA